MATLYVVTGDQYRMIDRRMREIERQLDQDDGSPLDPEWVAQELQRIVEGKDIELDISSLLADWRKFYADVFGITVDFSKLWIPPRVKGFDRLIVVAPWMTPQRLYDKCAELFPCWKWTNDNLDKTVRSDRRAKDSPYAVCFRDGVEADENLKNLSANGLKKKNILSITLEERLLMEIWYFKKTGNHLDIASITLCSGSRCCTSEVPLVHWSSDRLCVLWSPSGASSPSLRSRQAVS